MASVPDRRHQHQHQNSTPSSYEKSTHMVASGSTPSSSQPHTILSSLAPQLMSSQIIHSPAFKLDHNHHHNPPSLTSMLESTLAHITTRSRLLLSNLSPTQLAVGRGLLLLDHSSPVDVAISDPKRIEELLRLDDRQPFQNHTRLIQDSSSTTTATVTATATANVPLWVGFNATIPSASNAKLLRRKRRARIGQQLLGLDRHTMMDLKQRASEARGLLSFASNNKAVENDNNDDEEIENEEQEQELEREQKESRVGRRQQASLPSTTQCRRRRHGTQTRQHTTASSINWSMEELESELVDIALDRRNVSTRRILLTEDRNTIDAQIVKLQSIRENLEGALLALKEEDLELLDEEEGGRERWELKRREHSSMTTTATATATATATIAAGNATASAIVGGTAGSLAGGRIVPGSSRRRKGPAFLPTEHDDLPANVAFMTITGHTSPLTWLDFTEPYGTLVTASLDETVRLWDLTTGDEVGRLRGHDGVVKCLQVEGTMGVTGGVDGKVRLWDLEMAEEDASRGAGSGQSVQDGDEEPTGDKSCLLELEGHTQAVTALYFDANCLLTGSSDKTLRQWDLSTGQAVLTMDILWAMQNPAASLSLSASPPLSPTLRPMEATGDVFANEFASPSKRTARRAPSLYSAALFTPALVEGSLECYADFVGGVQFWGYALASGSGDGCVRMWDMRTGQAHRTLVGHTGPVSSLQFDEWHLVSGSVDKTVRVWDLRTGSIADTLRYEHAVTAVQFDSRKIIVAAGDTCARVFNRTTLQHSAPTTNGHTAAVERLRYVDRYMVTGGRECVAKVWSL